MLGHRLRVMAAVAPVALGVVVATPATAGAAAAPLEQSVVAAMEAETGISAAAVNADGSAYHADVRRRDGDWAFGMAVRSVAEGASDAPAAWLFLARQDTSGWTVALEGPGFAELAAAAPLSVFSATEKRVFAQREDVYRRARLASQPGTQAGGGSGSVSFNTGLQLPFKFGTSWIMTKGPHRWGTADGPWAFLDLAPPAGDLGKVRAAAPGVVYNQCPSGKTGWIKVVHANGYSTDYYHLRDVKPIPDGQWVDVGKVLGFAGTTLCVGGSATGPHVHWGLRYNDSWVSWHGRSAALWAFWIGASAEGNGYALRGSRQAGRGSLLANNGHLPSTNAIIDANGGSYINRRSGPGTNYPVMGTVADGTVVYVNCSRVTAQQQTGRWGSTPVWNRLADGTWITDAFAYTGRYFVGPGC